MARMITARMGDALRAKKPLALLAEIDHPDGLTHLWTGIGTLQYNNYPWLGVGKLGSITPIKRSSEIVIQELTFKLSGVSPDTTTWLTANVRNRSAKAWLACIDGVDVVADPIVLIDVLLDYQTLSVDENGNAIIELHALSGFYTLERPINEVWSSQDQQARYPGDVGFDMIDQLQMQEILWNPS